MDELESDVVCTSVPQEIKIVLEAIDRMDTEIIRLEEVNRKLLQCVNHYAENGYSKAVKCLKELE